MPSKTTIVKLRGKILGFETKPREGRVKETIVNQYT